MNTQNTQIHITQWQRGFWLLAIANFLVAMSVYVLVPVMPLWLINGEGFSAGDAGLAMGAFGVGMFAFGGFCSYLVQRYRRNRICMDAILLMVICITLLQSFLQHDFGVVERWWIFAQRILFGAVYGLAEMVLASTLIIDKCSSAMRTEANHSTAWFSRFAVALGPMVGLLVYHITDSFWRVILVSDVCVIISLLLIRAVKFPFRAPDENTHVFSLDRFFLPQGTPLFINIFLIMLPVGMLFSLALPWMFYAMMMAGFALALLAQRFVFQNAELKSEVVTGMILIVAAMQMMHVYDINKVIFVAPTMIGLAIGLIGSRFLLFFIKLSRHCQRGTSSSTFLLGWESSIAIGIGLGYMSFSGQADHLLVVAEVISILAAAMYLAFTHRWFLNHKNR
ncbi:MAG: MFS transporter [Prevotellaceae bacterium]|nr:MFS transporter [Prevotellaceae bacterium]